MQAMCSATEHMLAEVWFEGGVRDVYADFNELTLNITTNALFGVDMSSSQALSISGEQKWCTVHVTWCMVHGAWCMVRGAWCMVHGAWCMVHQSMSGHLEAVYYMWCNADSGQPA